MHPTEPPFRNPAPTAADAPAPSSDAESGRYACPNCGAQDLTRIPRNLLDRFLALFIDVKRFRCTHIGCHWEGILRSRRKPRSSDR